MRRKRNSKKTLILVIILLCLSLSIGYAYLSRSLHLNTSVTITKPQVEVFSLFDELKNNAIDDTNINFGAISSDTNGKGIYRLTKIETSEPIYYYRGEVDNNVIFGGFCWKIIRTTETGGVKLIYNGIPNEGVCNATGTAAEIGKSTYNTEDDDLKYFGYMYDDNTKESSIKSIIDEWFANNLLSYQDYLEDTPFYNERDYVAGDDDPIVFAPGVRLWGTKDEDEQLMHENPSIKLGATNKEDIFTVSSEIGNGKLTYPIGLLTSDEIVMAGATGWINATGYTGTNTTYYLYTGSKYWSMSPHGESHWGDINYQMLGVCDNGRYCNVEIKKQNEGVRPVISLKPNTKYLRGNGTEESPFVINE